MAEAAGTPGQPLGRQCLPRQMRLRKRAEYLAIQASAKKASGRHYTVLRSQAGRDPEIWRLGVTVSRKVGNAVVRNRIKRWIREGFRRRVDRERRGFAVVVIARPSAAGSSYEETARELAWLLERLGRR